MSLADLAGQSFGPFVYHTAPEKVGEYVAATGDDADRWTGAAPPSLAGALLFEVAPSGLVSAMATVARQAAMTEAAKQCVSARRISIPLRKR